MAVFRNLKSELNGKEMLLELITVILLNILHYNPIKLKNLVFINRKNLRFLSLWSSIHSA